jgi:hypothetical protein
MVYKDYMFESDANGIVITDYTGPGGKLDIPAQINGISVVKIGDSAFREKQLTSVTIPDTVVSIGSWAFACNNMVYVTISQNTKCIHEGAFSGNQLLFITIGANVIFFNHAIDELFETYYQSNGKKAGQYTRPNLTAGWSY